jgi:outer membrane protein OmpA-like peptidoglycan-associated protein
MTTRRTPFEIVTGALAALIAITLSCVSLETNEIQTGLAARAVAALDDADLYWFAIEPSGRDVILTGAARDEAAAQGALARLEALSGPRSIDNRVNVIGGAGDCQQRLDAVAARAQFRFGKGLADLARTSEPALSAVADVAKSCHTRIEVAVHGDPGAGGTLEQSLSQRRADVVVHGLAARGVTAELLVATGYGATQPVARRAALPAAAAHTPPDTPDGSAGTAAAADKHGPDRAAPQRVEFRILGAAT